MKCFMRWWKCREEADQCLNLLVSKGWEVDSKEVVSSLRDTKGKSVPVLFMPTGKPIIVGYDGLLKELARV